MFACLYILPLYSDSPFISHFRFNNIDTVCVGNLNHKAIRINCEYFHKNITNVCLNCTNPNYFL